MRVLRKRKRAITAASDDDDDGEMGEGAPLVWGDVFQVVEET